MALPKRLGLQGGSFLSIRLLVLLLVIVALSCAAPPPVTWDTVALTEGNVLTVNASAPEGLIPALFNDERRLHHIFKRSQLPPSHDLERPSFMVFADSDVVHASDNINFSVRIPLVTFDPRDAEEVHYGLEGVRICYVERREGASRTWWDDWRNGHCQYVLNQ